MKKSFLLYTDNLSILSRLTREQKGDLFEAIYQYNIGNEIKLDPLIELVFHPFRVQFKRDKEKYNESINQGKIGNLKRYHKDIYDKVIGNEMSLEEAESLAYPTKKIISRPPITPDQVGSLNDSVSVSVNVNDIKKNKQKKDFVEIPNFIKADLWNDFLLMRKKLKAINSERAVKSLVRELVSIKDAGYDPNACIDKAITNSWKSVYMPKGPKPRESIMDMDLSEPINCDLI